MNVNLKYGKLIPQGETHVQFVSWAGGELNIDILGESDEGGTSVASTVK